MRIGKPSDCLGYHENAGRRSHGFRDEVAGSYQWGHRRVQRRLLATGVRLTVSVQGCL